MPWFPPHKRGPEWKHGWWDRSLSSATLPPAPLLIVFAIIVLFLSLSNYMSYKEQLHHTITAYQLFLFLIPVALIMFVRSVSINGRMAFHLPKPEHDSIHRAGSSPWGVLVMVLLLLVMVSYQSSFHSKWFRPLWSSG